MFMQKHMPRRTLLRGVGAAIALPLLDAMVPAAVSAASAVSPVQNLKRLGYVYVPMGYNPAKWTPNGRDLQSLPSSLASLQPLADSVNVLTNLELRNAYPGSHATSNAAFLSAARAKRTESSDYVLGTTVDQIAAKHGGHRTQLPSLELSMDVLATVGQCDNGYACVYQNNLAWASPTQPLPSEAHPRVVFETLFGEGGSPEQRLAALRRRSSLLDGVVEELEHLQAGLGAADRNRLDEYLTTIREVERRIGRAMETARDNPLPDLDRPAGVPASYAEHAALMFDLQWLAFRGDITRIVTFQLAREASTRTYPEIGVPDPHHPVTHHGNDPDKLEKVAKINAFHVGLFADFLKRLKETPEGEGTMLDHTAYLYGSGMGDPDAHDHSNLPIVLAGGGGSGIKGGQHIRYDSPTPLANLHLTLLTRFGVPIEQFADSTGQMNEVVHDLSLPS